MEGKCARDGGRWAPLRPARLRARYEKYRHFREAVLQSIAQARLTAEIKAHDDSPLDWFKQGPGNETPNSPAWSTPVKPTFNQTNNTINLLLHPQMQSLGTAILQVLGPCQDAAQIDRTQIALPGRTRDMRDKQIPDRILLKSAAKIP